MQILNKLTSLIFPRRRGLDNYDAGHYDRVNNNWRVFNESAEITDRYSRDTVRARARDLERNSDMMNAVISAFKRNIVGGGYRLQAKTANEQLNDRLEDLWRRWCKKQNCDVTGTQSFNQLLRMCVERKKVDGGILIVKRFTDQGFIPFQLQLFEVDELDITVTAPRHKGNKDFKVHDNNYLSGPAGELLEVPEGGELKHDTFTDKQMPTRRLKTYGRQFTLTRQAFVNDDIELITKMPAKYAASARKTINKQVYEILVNNPVIYDGTALFNSVHNNVLATGTGITKDAIQAMISALQTQKDEFGNAIIIKPATIIVPVGYEFEMYTLFNSLTINTSGNTQAVNPLYSYRNSIEIIAEPTVNALCGGFGNVMPWWLVGSKDDTEFIQVDYLNGQEIPNIRRMEIPGTLGFVWDVYLDWGISVMDYRGAVKNPGVTLNSPLT